MSILCIGASMFVYGVNCFPRRWKWMRNLWDDVNRNNRVWMPDGCEYENRW